MTAKRIPLIPPGEILLKDFLEPMAITPYRLAKDTGMQPIAVKEIIDGKRGITAETALKLGAFFGMEAEFWINLQKHYDLERAREQVGETILGTVRPWQPAGAPASIHKSVRKPAAGSKRAA